jgi:glyoxylase-like metal-dependent hydrolase (beta-lactamase superfamily II)
METFMCLRPVLVDLDGKVASRRQMLIHLGRMGAVGAAGAGLSLVPMVHTCAGELVDFIEGPPVGDIAPRQLSKHVWMIYAKDAFPTPENQGMMANIMFVVTGEGVVVVDSGSSLQIGQMALRMIRKVTSQPVVAVFNSHFHGDHWLGNHAFADALGPQLPIYSMDYTTEQILGHEGNLWRSLMERWTNQSSTGTRVVPPNRKTSHGQEFRFGNVTLRMHHYGQAHTKGDLTVEVVNDKVFHVGDLAMENRIANIDDGSYPGTFRYFDSLQKAGGREALFVPCHGNPQKDLLQTYGTFLKGIWEPCVQAIKEDIPIEKAKDLVLKDPRVASRAKTMLGFDSNIGKYTSLAFLEAEKEAF